MKKRVFFLLLSLALMFMIYLFSDMPAERSNQLSVPLADDSGLSHQAVRKIAHFLCYFALSGSLFGFFKTFSSLSWPAAVSFPTTVFYAVTDEIHQSFVPGRACQLRDVLIDSAGALIFLLVWGLWSASLKARKGV